MLATVEASPQQWAHALDIASRAAIAPLPVAPRIVLVAGMGGSGIAGDVAAVVSAQAGRAAVLPVKAATLPAFVGPDTPVIAVSHSGTTEETLACVDAAVAAGAPWAAVTTGGDLAQRAEETGAAVVALPPGGQPRANLPYLVTGVLGVLTGWGIVDGALADLRGVPEHLAGLVQQWSHAVATDANLAKQLAVALDPFVPLFYGAHGWTAVAAMRAKCQVNENAKRPAFWNELPELDHNEVVGWRLFDDFAARLAVVEVRSRADEDAATARRFEATAELVRPHVGALTAVDVGGPTPLARFAATVLLLDLVSVHLALLRGEDPTPVEAIVALKSALSAS